MEGQPFAAGDAGFAKFPLTSKLHGRAGGIRTRDLLDPNEALYQAEPRPEMQKFLSVLSERDPT